MLHVTVPYFPNTSCSLPSKNLAKMLKLTPESLTKTLPVSVSVSVPVPYQS